MKQRGVYLFHFTPRYKHAGHYTGYADDLPTRITEQLAGRGAHLVRIALQNGCTLHLAKIWQGKDRKFERKLKNRGSAARYCPICRGLVASAVDVQWDTLTELEF